MSAARALEAVDESAGDELAATEAMQAEVAAEPDDGSVLVELIVTRGGKRRSAPIRVPSPSDWSGRAQRMLRDGVFDEWADTVLSERDCDSWFDLDPTNGEVQDFFKAWEADSGQNVGKSRASRRSSRNTARR